VTAFQEAGEQIMGMPAKDLHIIKFEEQDDTRFSEIIRSVLFKQFIFKLRVKEEMYNDEQRVKSTVVSAEKVDPLTESKYLLGLIDKMLLEDQYPNQNLYTSNTLPGNAEVRPNLYLGMREQQVVYCNSCGSSGHNGLNCPSSMNRQVGSSGGFANRPLNNLAVGWGSGLGNDATVCFKCQQPGHWAKQCPNMPTF
jgi:replication factor A1